MVDIRRVECTGRVHDNTWAKGGIVLLGDGQKIQWTIKWWEIGHSDRVFIYHGEYMQQ